jgi:predicted PurR-regulated permease PerM
LKKHRQYIVLSLLIGLGLLLFFSLKGFINAFLGAVLFYVLLKNWMTYLVYKRKWSINISATILMLLSFFIILLPIGLTSLLMYSKVKELIVHSDELTATFLQVTHRAEDYIGMKLLTPELLKKSSGYIQNFAAGLLNESATAMGTLGMMYFFLYFLLTNVRKLEKQILTIMPFSRKTSIEFGSELVSMTYSSAVGIPVIAIVQGLFAYVAYLIAGLPEPLFWASITALVSVVPVVGTAMIWVPAGIYMLAIGHSWQGVFLFVFGGVILSNVDNVVRFFIQKKFSDVHPVVTLLGVIVGLHYFGLPGILFGPLMISWFILLAKKYQEEFILNSLE